MKIGLGIIIGKPMANVQISRCERQSMDEHISPSYFNLIIVLVRIKSRGKAACFYFQAVIYFSILSRMDTVGPNSESGKQKERQDSYF